MQTNLFFIFLLVPNKKIKFNKSSKKINLRERNLQEDESDDEKEQPKISKESKDKSSIKNEDKPKSEDNSTDKNKQKIPTKEEIKPVDEKITQETTITKKDKNCPTTTKDETKNSKEQENKVPEKKLTRIELIEKLFTKRTVGKVFEEARNRYLQRKLQRAY